MHFLIGTNGYHRFQNAKFLVHLWSPPSLDIAMCCLPGDLLARDVGPVALVFAFVFSADPVEPNDVSRFLFVSLCCALDFLFMMVVDCVGGGGREEFGLAVAVCMGFGVDATPLRPRIMAHGEPVHRQREV